MSFSGIACRCTQPVRAMGVPSDQKKTLSCWVAYELRFCGMSVAA